MVLPFPLDQVFVAPSEYQLAPFVTQFSIQMEGEDIPMKLMLLDHVVEKRRHAGHMREAQTNDAVEFSFVECISDLLSDLDEESVLQLQTVYLKLFAINQAFECA